MAGEVLLLNFCAVTNGSASIEHLCYKAATTPSPEPLCDSLLKPVTQKKIILTDKKYDTRLPDFNASIT